MSESRVAPQRQALRFHKAFFEVHDPVATHEVLVRSGALALVEATSAASDRPPNDSWYRWEEPGGPALSFLIRIRGRRLVLEGPSAAAVARGWRALAEQLRPHARPRVAAGDDLGRFLPQQRRHSGDQPESWSREHREQVLAEFYRGFCARWVRQPQPMLHGHTPAEAAGDPDLRPLLEGLLERMQRVEDQRRSRQMPAISVQKLRDALAAPRGEVR